jgi:hypothetical protein
MGAGRAQEQLGTAQAALGALLEEAEELLRTAEEGQQGEGGGLGARLAALELREAGCCTAVEEALEELCIEVEDAEEEGEDVDERRACLERGRRELAQRRGAFRRAKLGLLAARGAARKAERAALLGGKLADPKEQLIRRQRRQIAAEAQQQGGSSSSSSSASAATAALRQMQVEMEAESARSAAALDEYAASTSVLERTNSKHASVGRGTDKAGELVGELARRERQDRQMMMAALVFFLATVLYVVAKRLPFICRLVPCFMGGCRQACVPGQAAAPDAGAPAPPPHEAAEAEAEGGSGVVHAPDPSSAAAAAAEAQMDAALVAGAAARLGSAAAGGVGAAAAGGAGPMGGEGSRSHSRRSRADEL